MPVGIVHIYTQEGGYHSDFCKERDFSHQQNYQ